MQDLVDHIRTVHFTLLVVTFVLTAALQVDRKRPLERAATDAEAILQLSERWNETTKALELALDARAKNEYSIQQYGVESGGLILPTSGLYELGSPVEPAVRKFVPIMSPWLLANKDINTAKDLPLLERWHTLNDFISFWDGLNNGNSAFLPMVLRPGVPPQGCGDMRPTTRTIDSSLFPSAGERFDSLYFEADFVARENWTLKPSILKTLGEPTLCEFREISVVPVTFDLAPVFRPLVPEASLWGNRTSNIEFSELIDASKYFEDSPLTNLASALRDRANTDTERIELFQAKIPPSAVPKYGFFILLLCQLYLLAHLLEFRRKFASVSPPETPTGYIGLYDDRLARILTIISLVAFPLCPLLIGIHQSTGGLRFWSGVSCVASVSIGVYSVLILLKLRSESIDKPNAIW